MIEDHVIAAQEALRFNSQLNDWERDFLVSMVHTDRPSPKQLTVLETLVAKARWRPPRPSKRRATGRARQ